MTIKAGNPNFVEKYTPCMDEVAINSFNQGRSITAVCCELGISRETYYRWKDDVDHPFSKVAKLGEMLSQSFLEEKGLAGTFGDLERFAGSTWQFIMKNRFRESYQADNNQDKTVNETLLEKLLEKL